MANKKQERNSANRQKDAQKRGRERKEVHRERNIGHKNAQEDFQLNEIFFMINIYVIQNNNPVTCCIIYAKPIADFNLQSNLDVTALHLAEHCAFPGDLATENKRCKQAYQFGKGLLEGKLTKQWIGFIFSFYAPFYQEAIIWFSQFINQIQNESNIKEFHDRKNEVNQELKDLSFIYAKCSAIRKKIFQNTPYKLSSGGKIELISQVTLPQINSFKKELSLNGQYFLNFPKTFRLNDFQQFRITNYNQAPKLNISKAEIKKNRYFDVSSRVFILPAMSSRAKLFLLGFFNYFRNSRECFDLECEISLFSNISVLYLIKKHIDKEFQLLIDFFHDNTNFKKAKSFALASMKEDLGFIQSMTEDVVLDWVNLNLNKNQEFDQVLKSFKKILLQT